MDFNVGDMISKAAAPFASGSFWAVTLAISVLMTTLVKSLRRANPNFAALPLVAFVLTWANVVLGVCSAIPRDVLPGERFVVRAAYGIVAGGMSHYTYQWVLRRFAFFGGKPAPGGGPGPAGGGGGDSAA
jgi:hypothetical protein